MPLPDTLIIGPMRCGTTWIDRYLRSHPDVCLPDRVKETFFFDRRFEKGLEWYASHFRSCRRGNGERICEVGASYFHSPEAPARIAETLGTVPLVVVVRHPVERSYSHYLHLCHYGLTSLPLRAAAEEHPEILNASRYRARLDSWLSHHDRRNLYLLAFETLKASSNEFVRRLSKAMEVSDHPVPRESLSSYNRGAEPRSRLIARLGWEVSDFLRGRRLHGIVEFAKRIGMKKFFFAEAGDGTKPRLTEADRQWLAEHLREEVDWWANVGVTGAEAQSREHE